MGVSKKLLQQLDTQTWLFHALDRLLGTLSSGELHLSDDRLWENKLATSTEVSRTTVRQVVNVVRLKSVLEARVDDGASLLISLLRSAEKPPAFLVARTAIEGAAAASPMSSRTPRTNTLCDAAHCLLPGNLAYTAQEGDRRRAILTAIGRSNSQTTGRVVGRHLRAMQIVNQAHRKPPREVGSYS